MPIDKYTAKMVPIKIGPDRLARGWVPPLGWYVYNTSTLRADLSVVYGTKKACQNAIDGKADSGRVIERIYPETDWRKKFFSKRS
jgi:hypothetical protein